jgi:SET domain-containing protein
MKLYKNRKSNIHRHGLSAVIYIKKGQRIIQYKGKKVSLHQVETDPKYDNDKPIYLFTLNKRYDLDGDFKFNTARLINHSCDPNCEVMDYKKQLWVFAMRDIKQNEELTYDYGFSFDKDYKQYVCKCGAKNCVGYIVREGSRWRIQKVSSASV